MQSQDNVKRQNARSDGSFVLFSVNHRESQVECGISRGALEDIAGARYFNTSDLLNCFETARARIETLALRKLEARSAGSSGRLNIWAHDIDPAPFDGGLALAAPAK